MKKTYDRASDKKLELISQAAGSALDRLQVKRRWRASYQG